MKLQAGKSKRARQATVLARLSDQLNSGMKPEKVDGKTTDSMVALTPKDIKRIASEITILEATLRR